MTSARLCRICGAQLPEDSPDGGCPACQGTRAASTADLTSHVEFEDVTIPPPGHQSEVESLTDDPSIADGPAADSLAGQTIGDYELLARIARGGMGVIYRARQKSLNREVAVKLILPNYLAFSTDILRFHKEAEAAGRLDHRNIVPIIEAGQHKEMYYLSMKLIDGGNLKKHIERLRGDPIAAANLMEIVARAIQYAHESGILHRDLKPGNILIDSDGVPYVTDFGLAKFADQTAAGSEQSLTQTGVVIGTPSYMPPEQAAGEKHLTVAMDVYSLGAILYELLVGKPPFVGDTPRSTILQVLEQEPVRPRALNPEVPHDLETICLKALAKEPRHRYPSAREMADDLNRFASGKTIQARRASKPTRLWQWCRRNPVTAGLSALTVLLVAALTALVASWLAPSPYDGSLDRVKNAGKLVIATVPTYPPMEFHKDGKLTGFDIDMARQLAHRLRVKAEFVEVDWAWDDLASRLDAHEFDILVSTISMREDRKDQVGFVEYLRIPMVYMCKKGTLVRNENDLAGKTVVVQKDTNAHKLAKKFEKKGVAIKQILVIPADVEPYETIRKGMAHVTIIDGPVAQYHLRRHNDLIISGTVGHAMDPDRIGIAFCKNDKALQAEVASKLQAMRNDGAWGELLAKWLGP